MIWLCLCGLRSKLIGRNGGQAWFVNVVGRENRDIMAKKMTPADISKAQAMAREWMEKHQE